MSEVTAKLEMNSPSPASDTSAKASVVRSGSESEAHLELPEPTLDSRMSEIALDHFAEIDFHLKTRAKQFWAFLAGLQEVRRGVQEARDKSSA